MTLKFLAEAEAEFLEAVLWYEQRRVGLGSDFHELVLASCSDIKAAPLRFPEYEAVMLDRQIRRALVDRFPYVVIYEVLPSEIIVIAVAHASRQSDYWQER